MSIAQTYNYKSELLTETGAKRMNLIEQLQLLSEIKKNVTIPATSGVANSPFFCGSPFGKFDLFKNATFTSGSGYQGFDLIAKSSCKEQDMGALIGKKWKRKFAVDVNDLYGDPIYSFNGLIARLVWRNLKNKYIENKR